MTEVAEGRESAGERRTEWAAERTDWAEERREWASLRTLLAKERTFTAWLRTGLAALVTGLAVLRFLADDGRSLPATLLGVLLVAASAVLFGLAFWSYRKALGELAEKGVRGLPTWILATVGHPHPRLPDRPRGPPLTSRRRHEPCSALPRTDGRAPRRGSG